MVGCELVFSGNTEEEANSRVMDHIIRSHEQNGAEERRIYLANQQATIVTGYMEKLREAKDLGVDTEMFMNLTGMKNGGLAGIGEGRSSKIEFPEWVKDQSFESWKAEFETHFDKILGKHKDVMVTVKGQDHPCEIRMNLEEKIRLDLITMLKKCENESVKNFFASSIINNNEVKAEWKLMIEKLEDRYGVSQKTKDSVARKELYNFEYTGKCTDIVDRIERLRKKVHASITCNSKAKNVEKYVLDKLILQDFLEKMKDLNRINSDDYRRMDVDFEKKEYDWDQCRKVIRTEIIEKEKGEKENDTHYQGNYQGNRRTGRSTVMCISYLL